MRGAVSSGFMGIGVATMVLTGGVAALALGAGASLSTMVLTLRRERTRDLESRRAKALQACRAWITEARSALGTYTDDLNNKLPARLAERGMIVNVADTASFRLKLGVSFYRRWRDQLGATAWKLLEDEAGRLI